MLNLGLKLLSGINWLRHREYPFSILYFHRVLDSACPFCPDDWTKEVFKERLAKLNEHFNIVSLSKALELQKQGNVPPRTLVLTFDDGYQDNYVNARPILNELGIRASFFVATQGTEQGYLWSDALAHAIKNTSLGSLTILNTTYNWASKEQRAQAYLELVGRLKVMSNQQRDRYLEDILARLDTDMPPRCMMTIEQLQSLQNDGSDIGAHTHSHSILEYQSPEVGMSEIATSIDYLNQRLARPVSLFAYPNGWFGRDFSNAHELMLRNTGVEIGVSTNDGGVTSKTRRTALPRFMPHRKEFKQFCLSIEKIAGE